MDKTIYLMSERVRKNAARDTLDFQDATIPQARCRPCQLTQISNQNILKRQWRYDPTVVVFEYLDFLGCLSDRMRKSPWIDDIFRYPCKYPILGIDFRSI